MRRTIITLSLGGWAIIFLITSHLLENLMMFVLFGFIPGTSISLSASDMQGLWALIAVSLILLAAGPMLAGYLTTKRPPSHRRKLAG
jgi:hypothetical protein